MSWKKLPSIRKMKMVVIRRGVWLCDWCGKKIQNPFMHDMKCSTVSIAPNYRGHFHIGPCCNDKLVKSLRDAGMKFRLRPIREESK